MTATVTAPARATRRDDWPFVLSAAGALAVVNGFVVTALRGAVGTVSRVQTPVETWVVQVAVMIPAVIVGLVLVTRVVDRHGHRRTLLAVLGAVGVGVLVGVGMLVLDGVVDQGLQLAQMQDMAAMDGMSDPTMTADMTAANTTAHVRAVGLGAAVMLVIDVLVVGWVVALLGGIGRRADA